MSTPRHTRRRLAAATATVVAAGAIPFVALATSAAADSTELFISEYVEGSSNNKALEIFNDTGTAVDLGVGGYNVQYFFNGAATAGLTINLTGSVADGDVFVLAQASASPAILAQADQTSSASWYNGDDAIVLRKGTTVVDSLGQIGLDPGTEWGTGLTSTADNSLRRKASIVAGDPNTANTFDPAVEWDGFATDTFDGIGAHPGIVVPPDSAPAVTATTPADGATGITVASNVTVSFSEPVDVTGEWFTLVCATSGTHTATVTGGPSAFTLDPDTDLALGESCTFTVKAAQVADQDANDPPNTMAADHVVTFATAAADPCTQPYTEISAIQGSGTTSPVAGATHSTTGIVVGDYEGATSLRGFFVQSLAADDDGVAETSEGLFVFEPSNADSVSVGDLVRVTGAVSEFQGQTQLTVGQLVVCGTGDVTPTDVELPAASSTFLERFEGMLVRFPQDLSVTEHFQLGRFGQVVVSQGGRLKQPTNVVAPGAEAAALQAANNLRKVTVDDALQTQNPDPIPFARGGLPLSASNTLRGGDTVTGLTGVLNWTWGGNAASPNAWRVRPTTSLHGAGEFVAVNDRPAGAPAVTGDTRVAGMNLLNFFNTFTGCTGGVSGASMDCRGANSSTEFERQWRKTVAAVSGTEADVVAFMEMENDGYGAGSAEAFLVTKLNEQDGAGTWAFIDADAGTGEVNALGTDAIKVGMLYKPAKVTPVGATAALNTVEFVNGGDSAPRNRPALAQAFQDNSTGGVFVAVANHLKSKGSACDAPDAGDGQGNCNAVRTLSAEILADWLAGDPTGTGETDALILGDLNSYAKEDPITALLDAGYHNLIEEEHGEDAYSYVFDGQWGYLDHALATGSLAAQVTGVADWHVNADEPSVLDYNVEFKSAGQVTSLYAPDEFRISDHDPVLVDLDLANAAPEVGPVTGDAAQAGSGLSVEAGFTDDDEVDTHTATIAWGDGTTTAGTVAEADGSGTVTGTHAYAAAGFYTVTVSVSDGVNTSTSSGTVVVYDAAAGFVSGGGWFGSPAGAIVSDPGFSGKARFTVDVEYAAGASTPTGMFTLAFDNHPFRIDATSFEWLVVVGNKATFAGPATVPGVDDARVEVTVVDGGKKADTIRVVVRDGAGALAYDSGVRPVNGQVVLH